MIAQMKRVVSKAAGRPIWQKSYHDHIIRGEALDSDARQVSFTQMMEIALRTAVRMAKM